MSLSSICNFFCGRKTTTTHQERIDRALYLPRQIIHMAKRLGYTNPYLAMHAERFCKIGVGIGCGAISLLGGYPFLSLVSSVFAGYNLYNLQTECRQFFPPHIQDLKDKIEYLENAIFNGNDAKNRKAFYYALNVLWGCYQSASKKCKYDKEKLDALDEVITKSVRTSKSNLFFCKLYFHLTLHKGLTEENKQNLKSIIKNDHIPMSLRERDTFQYFIDHGNDPFPNHNLNLNLTNFACYYMQAYKKLKTKASLGSETERRNLRALILQLQEFYKDNKKKLFLFYKNDWYDLLVIPGSLFQQFLQKSSTLSAKMAPLKPLSSTL